jgi:site-specific DNA recombinase
MKAPSVKPVRCAISTRVSTEQGLDQEFNSLDAQYDAASAYIKSQAHAGWTLIRSRYDDGGYSGGSTEHGNAGRTVLHPHCGDLSGVRLRPTRRYSRSLHKGPGVSALIPRPLPKGTALRASRGHAFQDLCEANGQGR